MFALFFRHQQRQEFNFEFLYVLKKIYVFYAFWLISCEQTDHNVPVFFFFFLNAKFGTIVINTVCTLIFHFRHIKTNKRKLKI